MRTHIPTHARSFHTTVLAPVQLASASATGRITQHFVRVCTYAAFCARVYVCMGVYVSLSVCYLQLAALVDMTYCQLGTHTYSSYNSLRSTSIYTCITYSSLRSFSVQLAALVVYTLIVLQLAALIVITYCQLRA
jgi:hypothetical protein